MNRFDSITTPLRWLMASLLIAFAAGCSDGSSNPGDTTAPTVISTVPVSAATGVAVGGNITVTFSEAMNPATLTTTTLTLMQTQTATPVPGVVTYAGTTAGTTATFNPTNTLAANTNYTATVTTGVKDLAGNALAVAKTWSFTTGAPDTTAPTVSSTVPINNATGVALNASVTATFSEAMDAATITTTIFTLKQGTTPIAGAVTLNGTTATFNPTNDLVASLVYTATITTGAKDLAGNALAANKEWSFTTGAAPDTTAPTVSSTVPINAATGVAPDASVTATFSEAMDAATITTTTFTLTQTQGSTAVSGDVTYTGTTATFNPTSTLTANTNYTATVTTGVKDLADIPLAANKVWSFTTAAAAVPVVCGGTSGANCVPLGTAGNYVILDDATVTFTPIATSTTTPTITGDIGVSPAAASFITGFALVADATNVFSTSTRVTGKIYASDYAPPTPDNLTTAIGDKLIAYNAAAAKPTSGGGLPTGGPKECPGAGAMSNVNNALAAGGSFPTTGLPAGVYTCTVNVTIPGTLTLNGSATDVWVFKTTGTLNQSADVNVVLAGGALPQNVFWQVAGGVTLGANAHMEGVVLSATNISLVTGATVKGRLLARTGVLMDSNTVTQPAP